MTRRRVTDGHTLYVLKHMYRCMFRVFFSQQSANIYSIFGLRKIAVSYGAKTNGHAMQYEHSLQEPDST